jgi:hypothetical protein
MLLEETAMTFRILYPYVGTIDDDTVERWFVEARAANEIGLDYVDARTPDEMADALDDMGFIRLSHDAGYDTLEEKRMDQEPKE